MIVSNLAPSITMMISFLDVSLPSFADENIVFVVSENAFPQDKHLYLCLLFLFPFFLKMESPQKGQNRFFEPVKKVPFWNVGSHQRKEPR